ncbi:uncharacterized protein UTRI_03130_B [Ustilago trichophora]|uniref:VanZ-like domain-containing protein n=1 Tax=Ustilago trichophora TaxID=86804 RepID=A0A5C3E5V5_9BASI|nr:uncharacterized protein UTRI_03130_B [Ustilago trichophora]
MPRLETTSGWSRLKADVAALFSPSTGSLSARLAILKTLLLRSVRLSLGTQSSSSSTPLLPLRIRPAFVILNILDLIFLGILGFHPRGQTWIRINDKILHFVCFFLATAMFYMIWDVDEPARASYLWRNASLILTAITCFLVGGIGSEIVQSLLPYKEFQIGDIVANLLGSSLGLFFSYHLEKRYRARRELERLYAPLDIEDYGDLDDETEDDVDSRPLQRPTAPRSSLKPSKGTASVGGKKKTRFDSNIWDDSVEIDTLPPRTKPSAAAASDPLSEAASSSTAAPAKRREDLFSIDDDEDDDGEADAGKASAIGALADGPNVWKQADS